MTEKTAMFNDTESKESTPEPSSLYPKMYAILCAAASDAIDALPHTAGTLQARCLLEKALREAEEIHLSYAE